MCARCSSRVYIFGRTGDGLCVSQPRLPRPLSIGRTFIFGKLSRILSRNYCDEYVVQCVTISAIMYAVVHKTQGVCGMRAHYLVQFCGFVAGSETSIAIWELLWRGLHTPAHCGLYSKPSTIICGNWLRKINYLPEILRCL